MATTAGLWSSAGSAGAVNPPDIGKVVLVGSVVQLGPTGGVITASPQVAARTVGPGAGPGTQAVIRYGVTALYGVFNPNPEELVVSLSVFCRPGSGQIAAQLVQVSTNSGPVPSVVETTLVEFQAQKTKPINPNLFTLQVASGGSALFDLQTNAYYVEVVLTAPGDIVTEYPPAVSAIQLSFSTPSSGGGGGGSGGGGGKGGGTTSTD